MDLEKFGIWYGMALSTLSVAWHCFKWFFARPKVVVSFREDGKETNSGYDRHYLLVDIESKRHSTIRIDSWGIDKLTKGEGPLTVPQSEFRNIGLPATLGPYGKVSLKLDRLEFLVERKPKVIYAEDWTGKKWNAGPKQVCEAIKKAQSIIEKNAKLKRPKAEVLIRTFQ